MALRAAVSGVVRFDGCEHCYARLNQLDAQFFRPVAQPDFATGERYRRQKFAVRLPPQPVVVAAHSDPFLGLVVIRRDLLVFDRPVDIESVVCGGLEIQIGKSPGEPAPVQRLAADDARTNP